MFQTTLIGDLHGQSQLKHLMTPYSIQLGDLDVSGYRNWHFPKDPRFVIPGNHDCYPSIDNLSEKPQELNVNLFAIPRGYVNGRVLFISGADSVDKEMVRFPGADWFPEETMSQREFGKIMDLIVGIEVVLAHDFPDFVYPFRCVDKSISHRLALQFIFYRFQPTCWIGAHHHHSDDKMIKGCRFITLNTNEVRDFHLPLANRDLRIK